MMPNVSWYVEIGFILTTVLTLWFFYKAAQNTRIFIPIAAWMILTAVLGIVGFYREVQVVPPRFVFLVGPWLVFFLWLNFSKIGVSFLNSLDLKWLTLLHVVRVPVEIVLFYTYLGGLIPKIMTFEGWNLDILSGLTAPLIYYWIFKKNNAKITLLIWNVICLGLLFTIVSIAILSAQTPFQQLAFDQPNVGVTYFPLVWLPTVVVPLVLLSHIVVLRRYKEL